MTLRSCALVVCLPAAATALLRFAPARSRSVVAQQTGWSTRLDEESVSQIAGWAQYTDEASGHPYYCHETGHCQWEPPQWEPPQAPANVQTSRWMFARHEGVRTEYTLYNGEERVLGRHDTVGSNPFVSREQCVVRVAEDGTASVVSVGKAQTHVLRQAEGLSTVLHKGESCVLQHEDQICLSVGTQKAIFTVYGLGATSATQAARHGAPQQPGQEQHGVAVQAQAALKSAAQLAQAAFDSATAQASAALDLAAMASAAAASHGGAAQQHDAQQQHGHAAPRDLPYPWEQLVDETTGNVYYGNRQTGETSWEPPQGGW